MLAAKSNRQKTENKPCRKAPWCLDVCRVTGFQTEEDLMCLVCNDAFN